MKVLIVAMYFPPAGGGGVQRPLEFAERLPELGVATHVLAPGDAKWLHRDESVEPPARAIVHRARNIGPAARRPGESGLEPRTLLRGLLAPDAGVLWNVTAVPAAVRLRRGARARARTALLRPPPHARARLGGWRFALSRVPE